MSQPSALELMGAYPNKARATGVNGSATIECIATIEGSLRDCKVKSEYPANLGFGQAALTMAPEFLMKPEIQNGRPVEIRVDIPIRFTGPGVHTGSLIAGNSMDVGVKLIMTRVHWRDAPTYADVAAIYPAKAKAKNAAGKATLRCVFEDEGKIGNCAVQDEAPEGYDFGNAARLLADKFRGPEMTAEGKSTKGVFVVVPVVFPTGMGDGSALYITTPAWLRTPNAQMFAARFPIQARVAGVSASRVVLACSIGPRGGLIGCNVNSETPGGLGFGEAALSMAPAFLMNTWTDDGQAMVGRKINLPVRYQMDVKQAAPAAPAAADNAPAPGAQAQQ